MLFNSDFFGKIIKALTQSVFNRSRTDEGYPFPTPPHVFRIEATLGDGRIEATSGDARITADSNY